MSERTRFVQRRVVEWTIRLYRERSHHSQRNYSAVLDKCPTCFSLSVKVPTQIQRNGSNQADKLKLVGHHPVLDAFSLIPGEFFYLVGKVRQRKGGEGFISACYFHGL